MLLHAAFYISPDVEEESLLLLCAAFEEAGGGGLEGGVVLDLTVCGDEVVEGDVQFAGEADEHFQGGELGAVFDAGEVLVGGSDALGQVFLGPVLFSSPLFDARADVVDGLSHIGDPFLVVWGSEVILPRFLFC